MSPSTATARSSGPWTVLSGHDAGCLGSTVNPVHHFDDAGREIAASAAACSCGRMASTSIATATSGSLTRVAPTDKGSVVVKFSPEGKVLLTLGKPGVRGNPPEALDRSDRRRDRSAERRCLRRGEPYRRHRSGLVGRISVFDRSRKVPAVIGKTGTGPGDSGRRTRSSSIRRAVSIVADRHNHRIQILTKEGKFIAGIPSSAGRAGSRSTRMTSFTPPTRSPPSGCIQAGSEGSASGVSRTGR